MLFLGFFAVQSVPRPPEPGTALLVAAAFAVVLALIAYLINRLAVRQLFRRSVRAVERRQTAMLAEAAVRMLLTAAFIAAFLFSSLPWALDRGFGWHTSGPLPAQLIGLALYFIYFICAWLPLYGLHRAVTPGRWTRWSFLANKIRYNLYFLVAWVPFTLFSEWLANFLIALPLIFILAAWSFPWVLAKLWGCKPLSDPDTLNLVADLEKKAGAKFSRTFIWEPGGGNVQNAAAVGVFRPFRYLFLTPALLRNMNRDELSGVILHELGHVRHKHLLFYMFTTLAGVNLAVLAAELLPLQTDMEMFAVIAILVILYFRFAFGWLSRTMERQADLFSLEKSGSASGLVNALEKLALSAGNIRLAASWHHLGIAERVRFLREAELNPRVGARHNRLAGNKRFIGYALSIFLLAMMATMYYDDAATPGSFPTRDFARRPAHWRRVMELLPASPVGPLELAYSLSRDPGRKEEAIRLAARAIDLSCLKEEREAAEKLIENLTEESP
jgi:Zn-dependent protease with chaperone function